MGLKGALLNLRDWARLRGLIAAVPRRLEAEMSASLLREAARLEGEVKKGIRNQAPGGRPFRALRPSTIAHKRRKGKSKTLIVTGSLLGSIKAERLGPLAAFVGVARTARGGDGRNVFDVALALEFGTQRMAPLPFIRPVFEAERPRIEQNIGRAVARVVR